MHPTRRAVMGAAAALTIGAPAAAAAPGGFVSQRPPVAKRRFVSAAVERELGRLKACIADPELAWMFENCYPNTLDTTVFTGTIDGKPDTFVITGDIDAMWLRDSAVQVEPYLPLARDDRPLREMLHGLIQRQARCILIDPYANAFVRDPGARSNLDSATLDDTEMRPGVAQRKWEIDSLCYPMRLAHDYWAITRDRAPFDELWRRSAALIVATLRVQQRKEAPGPYRYQRLTKIPTDSLMLDGYGPPSNKVGLIHSAFRPSDDACVYPFLVPANLFAVSSLRQVARVHREARGDAAAAREAEALANEVEAAVRAHAIVPDGRGGQVWAYEVDGFGNWLFADDAGIPSLYGLPLIEAASVDDPLYQRTAALAWSPRNPFFVQGSAASGIGSPHMGLDKVWPMALIARAMVTRDEGVVRDCLRTLKATHAGTGFMHESFHKDDPARFTRAWFAWVNGMFGQMIGAVAARYPRLLAERF
ncbi:glycoside hydrolase family 125 protein [Sphingomonas citri]